MNPRKFFLIGLLLLVLGFGAYGLSQSKLLKGSVMMQQPVEGGDCGNQGCIVTPGVEDKNIDFGAGEEEDPFGVGDSVVGGIDDYNPDFPGGGFIGGDDVGGGGGGGGDIDPGYERDPEPPAQQEPADEIQVVRFFVQVEDVEGTPIENLSKAAFSTTSTVSTIDLVEETDAGLYRVSLRDGVTFIGYQLTVTVDGYSPLTQRVEGEISDDLAEDQIYSFSLESLTRDSDSDGLEDIDETTHGTDLNDSDTDDDRLLDGEEVNTYRTDPRLADTDGGSVNDGVEVRRGTNPKKAADDVREETVAPVEEAPADAPAPAPAPQEPAASADTFSCSALTFSANTTKIKAIDSPKDVTLTVRVTAKKDQVAFTGAYHYLTQVIQQNQPEDLMLAEENTWSGTLIVTTSRRDGVINHNGSSEEGQTVFIPLMGLSNTETFSYEAEIGDALTAYIQNESDCFESLSFTEEAAPALTPQEQETILKDESFVCTHPFEDTEDELLCRMREAEIFVGVGGGKFGDRTILEAEWVKVLLASQGYTAEDAKGLPSVSNLPNYNANKWYDPWYRIAVSKNIIRGYAAPEQPITRATAAVLAARSPKSGQKTLFNWGPADVPFDDLQKDPSKTATSASDYIQETYAIILMSQDEADVPGEGKVPIISGYANDEFRPYELIKRKDAVYMLYRIILAWDFVSPLDTEGL